MINYILIIKYSLIFLINLALTRLLLRNLNYYLMDKGIYGIDINKPGKVKVPEEGGVSITISLIFSFSLLWTVFRNDGILLIIITSFLISLIGFIDHYRNIRPYPKFIYCAVIGSLYSFFLISDRTIPPQLLIIEIIILALGYSVLVNSYNLLAGFNGLESGVTVIASISLTIYFFIKGLYPEAGIAFLVVGSYLVFWQLNKYPAKIFIGDSGTLLPASIFFGLGILSKLWLPILFVTAPHLINAAIKFFSTGVSSRSDLKPLIYKDGLLQLPENYYLSLIRLILLKGPMHEKQIVYYIYCIEVIFCSLIFIFL